MYVVVACCQLSFVFLLRLVVKWRAEFLLVFVVCSLRVVVSWLLFLGCCLLVVVCCLMVCAVNRECASLLLVGC